MDVLQDGCPGGIKDMENVYGECLNSTKIITVAPELTGILDLIPQLTERGIVVSLGTLFNC